MSRTTALLVLTLSSLLVAGCDESTALGTNDDDQSEDYRYGPDELVWYDDELDACFTKPEGGKAIEVPCPDESESIIEDAP